MQTIRWRCQSNRWSQRSSILWPCMEKLMHLSYLWMLHDPGTHRTNTSVGKNQCTNDWMTAQMKQWNVAEISRTKHGMLHDPSLPLKCRMGRSIWSTANQVTPSLQWKIFNYSKERIWTRKLLKRIIRFISIEIQIISIHLASQKNMCRPTNSRVTHAFRMQWQIHRRRDVENNFLKIFLFGFIFCCYNTTDW